MRIGFVGLGNMGGRMAACIVRAGQEVLSLPLSPAHSDEDIADAVDAELNEAAPSGKGKR